MAQNDPLEGKTFLGLGFGLDHGGIGLRVDVRAIPHLGVFGGVGYAFAGLGWNAGLVYRILPEKKADPYVTGMYGYNTAYILRQQQTGTNVDQALYYGPSFGGGVELRVKDGPSFLHFALLIPIRSDQIELDHPGITKDLLPIAFSIGYHFQP